MENIGNIIHKNNELLKEMVKISKTTKRKLEKELINNYSDELFNKVNYLNNEIRKAENLIDAPTSYGHKFYAKNYPDNIDSKGNINDTGKKRFNFLRKKFGFITFS